MSEWQLWKILEDEHPFLDLSVDSEPLETWSSRIDSNFEDYLPASPSAGERNAKDKSNIMKVGRHRTVPHTQSTRSSATQNHSISYLNFYLQKSSERGPSSFKLKLVGEDPE